MKAQPWLCTACRYGNHVAGKAKELEKEYHDKRRNVSKPALHEQAQSQRRNPSLAPTEYCESDETEEEGTAPFIAPPGLPDPLIEETRIGEVVGCQTDATAKAENRLHSRCKQIKDARPFEVIITDKNSSELSGQKRLSILSWNAGPKRGEVTSSTVGSFHVIMVQEAQTHCNEIRTSAEKEFHIYQGAGQLTLHNKSSFEIDGVKIQEEIQGTSM